MFALSPVMLAVAAAGPAPVRDWDFTSGVPADFTLTRASATTAIVNGQFSAVSAGQPRIESWEPFTSTTSEARGLAVDPVKTNNFRHSSVLDGTTFPPDYNDAVQSQESMLLPDGTTGLVSVIREGTSGGGHGLFRGDSLPAGENTYWLVYKSVGPAMRGAQFALTDNSTFELYVDSIPLHGGQTFGGHSLGVENIAGYGTVRLANGWFLAWITTTHPAAGTFVRVRPLAVVDTTADTSKAPGDYDANYTGDGSSGIAIWHVQATPGKARGPRIVTGAAAASSTAESVVCSAPSFVGATGTWVIEHDVPETGAVLLGSGANTLVSAPGAIYVDRRVQRIAVAYDGTETRTTIDGAGDAVGAPLTMGADLRLLGTSAGVNSGRVRRIRYYATKLTLAERQALTAPQPVNAGTLNAWRFAGHRCRLPQLMNTASGSLLSFAGRYEVYIGSGDRDALRLLHNNWVINVDGPADVGNAVIFDEVAIEKDGGGYAPVTYSGGRQLTMAAGAYNVVSDDVLPSAFGLTKFTQGDRYWIRFKGHVTTAGHGIACGRGDGQFQAFYNPSATTVSAVDETGDMSPTGDAVNQVVKLPVPVLLGRFTTAAKEPAVLYSNGDSTSDSEPGEGNWMLRTLNAHPDGRIAWCFHAAGQQGNPQLAWDASFKWRHALAYANVYFDLHGINGPQNTRAGAVWHLVRQAPTIRALVGYQIPPRNTSTDGWATYANQSVSPYAFHYKAKEMSLANGQIDAYFTTPEFRGPGAEYLKWFANGTPGYATDEGTHQSSTTGTSLVAAGQGPARLAAITRALPQPA